MKQCNLWKLSVKNNYCSLGQIQETQEETKDQEEGNPKGKTVGSGLMNQMSLVCT